MRPNKLILGLVLLSSVGFRARAQDSLGFPRYQGVIVDFQRHNLSPSYLPFDVPFRLIIPAPDSLGIDSIKAIASRMKKGTYQAPVFLGYQPLRWSKDAFRNPPPDSAWRK